MKIKFASVATCALVVGIGQAHAATIDVSVFSVGDYLGAVGGFNVKATEDFEGFQLSDEYGGYSAYQPDGNAIVSSTVGSFESAGGTGGGGTVTDPNPNLDGTKIAVRTGNVYGRSSTTDDIYGNATALQFLDSNDTLGINWTVNLGGTLFNTLAFVMSDATDVGATLGITAGGVTEYFSNLGTSNQKVVVVSFANLTDNATVNFVNNKINDGFSVDDIAVGVSPVPLPAGGLLLLTAFGALGATKRRKKRDA